MFLILYCRISHLLKFLVRFPIYSWKYLTTVLSSSRWVLVAMLCSTQGQCRGLFECWLDVISRSVFCVARHKSSAEINLRDVFGQCSLL